jgi:hypothetical protein
MAPPKTDSWVYTRADNPTREDLEACTNADLRKTCTAVGAKGPRSTNVECVKAILEALRTPIPTAPATSSRPTPSKPSPSKPSPSKSTADVDNVTSRLSALTVTQMQEDIRSIKKETGVKCTIGKKKADVMDNLKDALALKHIAERAPAKASGSKSQSAATSRASSSSRV